MMVSSFMKMEPKRFYPYLAERTDNELCRMVVIFVSLDKAIKIGLHTIEVVEANEHDYAPIQGAFTLAFGGESERLQGGGPVLETRGRL